MTSSTPQRTGLALLAVVAATTATGPATASPWVSSQWSITDEQGSGGLVGIGMDHSGLADLFLNQQVTFADPQPLRVLGGSRRPLNRSWDERESLPGDARVVRTNGEGRVLVVWRSVSPEGVRTEAFLVGEPVEPLEALEESPLSLNAAFSRTGMAVVAIGDRRGLRVFERPPDGRWSSARILATGRPVGQSIMAINDTGDVVVG